MTYGYFNPFVYPKQKLALISHKLGNLRMLARQPHTWLKNIGNAANVDQLLVDPDRRIPDIAYLDHKCIGRVFDPGMLARA